jgi:hypothetical protein
MAGSVVITMIAGPEHGARNVMKTPKKLSNKGELSSVHFDQL